MGTLRDLTGRRFGRLVVIERSDSKIGNATWSCQCDCGERKVVRGDALRTGATVSCGCFYREEAGRRLTTHGYSGSPEYLAWMHMKERCNNSHNQGFVNYGGRGIGYTERWESFEKFLADMGCKPSPDLSIERVENDKGYTKENCIWGTSVEQNRNKRPRKDSVTGVTGVTWDERKRKFKARITAASRCFSLGYFSAVEDAILARKAGERRHWGAECQ